MGFFLLGFFIVFGFGPSRWRKEASAGGPAPRGPRTQNASWFIWRQKDKKYSRLRQDRRALLILQFGKNRNQNQTWNLKNALVR